MTFLPPVIAAVISWLVLRLLLARPAQLPTDLPNQRSLHTKAVPRGGGIAIWAGWLAAIAWLPGPKPWLFPAVAVMAVSFCDDYRPVPVVLRLLVHAAAAAAWVMLALPDVHPIIATAVIVWMANLYNFMDGSDGLAAAMALTGFGAYAAGAWIAGNADAPVLLAIAAAVVPFLAWNWPPARIFLGDVGAVPMGFLAGVFGIAGWQQGFWPAWFPALVFMPFIADATVTLARRILRAERIWEAHRSHYYQRVVRLGGGHAGALALYGALMIGGAASALLALAIAPSAGPALLAGWTLVIVVVFGAIDYYWHRHEKEFDESKC